MKHVRFSIVFLLCAAVSIMQRDRRTVDNRIDSGTHFNMSGFKAKFHDVGADFTPA